MHHSHFMQIDPCTSLSRRLVKCVTVSMMIRRGRQAEGNDDKTYQLIGGAAYTRDDKLLHALVRLSIIPTHVRCDIEERRKNELMEQRIRTSLLFPFLPLNDPLPISNVLE